MPAYRDYSGSGTVSDGQRDIGGAAIGTGVLIHKGVGYADSQGCNVGGMEGLLHRLNTDMSQDQSDDKASETSMSDKGKHIGYLVIEAKNLPPFE